MPTKSQIDLFKNYTGIQLRETNSSATNVYTFEEINLRDPLDILCQTFVHTSCPGIGQTEGTIPYIHLSHCYLRLIQQPLHFTPSSIIFGIYDSQRLYQYRVVLWIKSNRTLHINNVKMVKTLIVCDLTIKEKQVCKQRYYFQMEIISNKHHLTLISLVQFTSPVSLYSTFAIFYI